MSEPGQKTSMARRLIASGIIFSVVSFGTGLVNLAFQGLIGRRFVDHPGEFGLANNVNSFVGLLGLPLLIATTAVTHYIAHFQSQDDQARLRGLLLGCRRVLLWFSIGGSVLAILLVAPLSNFFNFPRYSLTLVALVCVLAGLWGGFATALCQGLSWFKRLAIIGLMSALLRCGFTWFVTQAHPVAEIAVVSTAVAVMANVVLIYWRKEIFQHGEVVSPWDREFVIYLIAGAACVGGNYCFLQGDQLASQRNFGMTGIIDHYSTANRLATAVPMVVGPLLIVLFTSRSGKKTGDALSAQLKLMGLYGVGLLIGVAVLLAMRGFCVQLIRGQASPEAAEMIAPLALTMVFGGLLQGLGMWALASRWFKVSLLYGALGLIYWLVLLGYGTTSEKLLHLMPWLSGAALAVLFIIWLVAMKQHGRAGAR